LIVSFASVVLLCSVVVVLSEAGYLEPPIVITAQEVIPPGECVPKKMPERLPSLASHEEAITLANEFLKERLGDEFFNNHFNVIGIDERPEIPSLWFIIYEFIYNGYTIDVSVAVDIGRILKDSPRIVVDFSTVTLEPQEILISEEQAKIIAQENGLEPPYSVILSCEIEFHRICWRIVKQDRENLKTDDLAGLLIDAESGVVLKTWVRGR